jgi:Flp pilus assembly pilin Flp
MTFAAAVPYALLMLFGAALVVAAFNAKRLIRWENRALTSLADAVRDYRATLEEEQRLMQGGFAAVAEAALAQPVQEDVRAA